MAELTQNRLKSLVNYNPETGIFINICTRGPAIKGNESGCVTISSDGLRYRSICIDRKEYKAHRLAFLYMNGKMPVDEVDHINGNTEYNKWLNLREVNRQENSKNMGIRKDNKSGVVGVCWSKISKKWQSSIPVNNKFKHLGFFSDIKEAIKVRKNAEVKYGFHKNHGRPTCYLS